MLKPYTHPYRTRLTHMLFCIQVYLAEISPPKRRGLLGTAYQIAVICGIFLSYVIGAIPGLNYGHSALFIIMVLLVFLPLMLIPKESPRWLLVKKNRYAARKSLLWLFQSDEAVDDLIQHIEASLPTKNMSFKEKVKMFTQRSIYLPFTLSIFIIVFHQYTGNNVIIGYAASVFLTANVSHAKETAIYAVGALQIVGTLISAVVVDKFGRKKLLLFGSFGIAVSNTALGTHLYITETMQCDSNNTFINETLNGSTGQALNFTGDDAETQCYPAHLSILPIASVMGYGLFYSIGWRALPFIIMGEIFPNTLRSTMNGILVAFLWCLVSILFGGFTPYESAVRPYTAWWVFAGVAVVSIPFIALLLPETKGKTLEQIEQYFLRKKKPDIREAIAASNPMLVEGAIDCAQKTVKELHVHVL